MAGYTRQAIVAAIQQATAHDGGKPVGVTRFQTLTGIPQAAWRGVYWPRWSDALREAGFEPNTWTERRGQDDLLIEAAGLVRRFGKVPTELEWRLARRSDPKVPSRTVLSRLGGRRAIIGKLRDLAESDPAHIDLLDLLPEPSGAGTGDDEAPETSPAPAPPTVTGTVYLARMGKYHKVGRTNAVGRRMYELGRQLPDDVKVVHRLETDDPEGIERYWLERFKDKQTKGEWFLLSSEDVAAFKRRGKYM
jgi:hypothetical protein